MATQTSTAAPSVDYEGIINRKQQEIYNLAATVREARIEVENAKRKEQQDRELAERAAATRRQKLAKLEAEKADLTPEAYERRLAAIMATT